MALPHHASRIVPCGRGCAYTHAGTGATPGSHSTPEPTPTPGPTPAADAGSATAYRAALAALYRSTDGDEWGQPLKAGWLTDAPLGQWQGIETDTTGRAIAIQLGGKYIGQQAP